MNSMQIIDNITVRFVASAWGSVSNDMTRDSALVTRDLTRDWEVSGDHDSIKMTRQQVRGLNSVNVSI